MGVPQNGWSIMESTTKMDDWGVHPFMETPILWEYPHIIIQLLGHLTSATYQWSTNQESCWNATTNKKRSRDIIFSSLSILVGGWATPLKNMSPSIGMMTFPISGKIKNGNQTTNQVSISFPWFALRFPYVFPTFSRHFHPWFWTPRLPRQGTALDPAAPNDAGNTRSSALGWNDFMVDLLDCE